MGADRCNGMSVAAGSPGQLIRSTQLMVQLLWDWRGVRRRQRKLVIQSAQSNKTSKKNRSSGSSAAMVLLASTREAAAAIDTLQGKAFLWTVKAEWWGSQRLGRDWICTRCWDYQFSKNWSCRMCGWMAEGQGRSKRSACSCQWQ